MSSHSSHPRGRPGARGKTDGRGGLQEEPRHAGLFDSDSDDSDEARPKPHSTRGGAIDDARLRTTGCDGGARKKPRRCRSFEGDADSDDENAPHEERGTDDLADTDDGGGLEDDDLALLKQESKIPIAELKASPRRQLLGDNPFSDSDDDDDSNYAKASAFRFSLDEGAADNSPSLERLPPGPFARVAEHCWVRDLQPAAAASKRMHLAVRRLRWRCQKCGPGRGDGAGAGEALIFADGRYGDEIAGNCTLCRARMCDMHMRSRYRQTDGCRDCGRHAIAGADGGCCWDCAAPRTRDLFACHRCEEQYCIEGDCGNAGDGKDTCNGEGCNEMLCGNCSNVGYESGWAPHCCGVEGCPNSSGWSGYCSACSETCLVDHSPNEDICREAAHSGSLYLCTELHRPGATCSGPCGRSLCASCEVKPRCPLCDRLSFDAGTGRPGCRCLATGSTPADERGWQEWRTEWFLIRRPMGSSWTRKLPVRCRTCWVESAREGSWCD